MAEAAAPDTPSGAQAHWNPNARRAARAFLVCRRESFGSRIAGFLTPEHIRALLRRNPSRRRISTAAFRIPNLLQNLFGEGVLSASFIPEYAALLARGDTEMADQVAGAVLGALALVASSVVLLGVLTAPYLVDILAGGFNGPTHDLAVTLSSAFSSQAQHYSSSRRGVSASSTATASS